MSAETNKQHVLDFIQAIAEGRKRDAMTAFREDAVWHAPPSLGGGRPIEGRQAIFDTYFAVDEELFETGTREYDFEILGAIAEGDRVAVEMRHRGVTAKGKPFETDHHVAYDLCDGLIVEVREYLDSLYFQREVFES
jgi:ketosteroid isomerase-like protein